MTSIGLFVFIFSCIVGSNNEDKEILAGFCAVFAAFGFTLFVCGLFMWLWRIAS